MNQSHLDNFGEMSAEIVATTNEPLAGKTILESLILNSNRSQINDNSSSIDSTSNKLSHLPKNVAQLFQRLAGELIESTTSIEPQQRPIRSQRELANEHQLSYLSYEPNEQFSNLRTAIDNNLMEEPRSSQMMAQQASQEQSFSGWWQEYWSRQPFPSGYTQSSITLLACFISLIIFLIVVGNLLVCIAIFTEKSLKPTQNWFIASLAVSDLLLGLLVMPISLTRELMGFWAFGPLWCDVHEAIDVLLTTASINTLCLISLDRYWSITQAVSYLKKRTPRRGAFMIAFVWIFSAAVSLPPLFGWKKESPTIKTSTMSHSNSSSIPQVTSSTTTTTTQIPDRQTQQANSDSQLDYLTSDQETSRRKKRRTNNSRSSNETARSKRHQNGLEDDFTNDLTPEQRPKLTLNSDQMLSNFASNNNPNYPTTSTQLPPMNQNQNQIITTTEYPSCELSDDVGYVLYSAIGSFYIPCAVMVFTYIKIFLAARSRARRAINKQSRGQAAANKRMAARRANATPADGKAARNTPIEEVSTLTASEFGQQAKHMALSSALKSSQINELDKKQYDDIKLMGKLVIVDRKKSIVATSLMPKRSQQNSVESSQLTSLMMNQLNSTESPHQNNSDQQQNSVPNEKDDINCCYGDLKPVVGQMTLCTSVAKQASINALNSEPDISKDSSMVTVMNASMVDTPITRFNFQSCELSDCKNSDIDIEQSDRNCDHLETASWDISNRNQDKKAEALLKALGQIGANFSEQAKAIAGSEDDDDQVPDIVLEQRPSIVNSSADINKNQTNQSMNSSDINPNNESTGASFTNETCFMTIEEDSDMFDAQAGRTIMMIAGNASGRVKQANSLASGAKGQNIMMTMMPPSTATTNSAIHSQGIICNNVACRQQRLPTATTRSASSYCGSSLTINEDDIDDCVDDELLTDDCNGYSTSCGFDQYCSNASASACPHCAEFEQQQQQAQQQHQSRKLRNNLDDQSSSLSSPNRHLSTIDSPQIKFKQPIPDENLDESHKHKCVSELEAQSLTGDDNLSLTEYRSNEDSSSIMGHDVLDATESHRRYGYKKKSSNAHEGSAVGQRKKSGIGFRLARLGSTAPLTSHSGGLLALASSQQRQASQPQSIGTRNLKALRQNFFLKLNQLTAKSAAKQESKNRKAADKDSSPNAPSSGTSYEPSVDYATTSNVHSGLEYHHENTMGETDDYEHQTSSDNQHKLPSTPGDQLIGELNTSNDSHKSHLATNADQLEPRSSDGQQKHSNTTTSSNQALIHSSDKGNRSNQTGHMDLRTDHNHGKHFEDPSKIKLKGSSDLIAEDSYEQRASNRQQRFEGMKSNKSMATKSNQLLNRSSTLMSSQTGQANNSSGHRAYLASDNERHKRKLAKARERRATLILGIIMTAFICSWLPFFTNYVLRALCTVCREYISPRFEAFIFWMGYCNSAINPIIYTIFNRDFRKAFRKILFRCF